MAIAGASLGAVTTATDPVLASLALPLRLKSLRRLEAAI